MKISQPFRVILFFYVLILYSCGNQNLTVDDGYYFENFDNLKMWHKDALVTKDRAHSGSYSTFTNQDHEFSQVFEMDLDVAIYQGYRSMEISGWCCKEDDNTQAGFVVSVNSPDKTIKYHAIDLASDLKTTDAWELLKIKFVLPAQAPDDSKIRVYLWSPKKQSSFLDDVEIRFKK